MKLLIMILSAAIVLNGCKTPPTTPYPDDVTAVFVGLGYTCDKKEVRKSGSSIDVSTMVECVRRAYNDYKFKLKCKYMILQDSNATIHNVKTILRQSMYSDLAIIYFSCKATQVKADSDTDEVDGLDECLVLYDGLLKDNDIWEIVQNAKGRVFIIFDTGHSETMLKASKDNIISEIDFCDDKNIVTNSLNLVCWSACEDNATIKEKGTGSKLTNCIYFKFYNDYVTYDEVFNKCKKSLEDKQNIKKTVIGKDFSGNSMFR